MLIKKKKIKKLNLQLFCMHMFIKAHNKKVIWNSVWDLNELGIYGIS